jgi:hypothetical protein
VTLERLGRSLDAAIAATIQTTTITHRKRISKRARASNINVTAQPPPASDPKAVFDSTPGSRRDEEIPVFI